MLLVDSRASEAPLRRSHYDKTQQDVVTFSYQQWLGLKQVAQKSNSVLVSLNQLFNSLSCMSIIA